jgi:acyl dehydratase
MAIRQLQYNHALVGVDHPAGKHTVTEHEVRSYCSSTVDTNPLYSDEEFARASGYRGVLAPPAFCALLVWAIRLPNIDFNWPGKGLLATERIHCLASIFVGDTLSTSIQLKEVYTKTGRSGLMAFVVWSVSVTNQRGHLVSTVESSFVYPENTRE